MIRLIAFLGNPEPKFKNNRHNYSWLFLESLHFTESLQWTEDYHGLYAIIDFGYPIYLLKPTTFMNSSGKSIKALAEDRGIQPSEILIVHDELGLEFGTYSLKFGGGLNGHNGLRSVRDSFNSVDFWRLRLGISKPDNGQVYDYVLSDFSTNESRQLNSIFLKVKKLFFKIMLSEPEQYLETYRKVTVI